jgi:hypothetical protein
MYCAAVVLESDKILTAWQYMYVYCIFSAFFQYSHVLALEVAFFFSSSGNNGLESWNYGFVSCFFGFVLMNSYINNTETEV